MTDEEARELAEAHWRWLESLLHKLYVDAMVHGFGHGVEWQVKRQQNAKTISRVDLDD